MMDEEEFDTDPLLGSEEDFEQFLEDAIREEASANVDATVSIRPFREAGVLTMNWGLVVRIGDRAEYQITIVKSR